MSPLCTQKGRHIGLLLTAHFYVTLVLCLSVPGYCWPTLYDDEPTLAQYWVTLSCLTPRCMWASVTDGGPTLTQLLVKALCGYYSQHEVGLLTTVEWILASTGDAGPAFTRHWVGVGAVDVKNGFHHIKMHSLYLSTVQMSYLVTFISKAFDTTFNSYQPLWLRCWKGDISSFSYKKTRLF